MRASFYRAAWVAGSLTMLLAGGCGDDDDEGICGEAWDKHCACPNVSCEGRPQSCTGPDKEWAMCVLDAEDGCKAECR